MDLKLNRLDAVKLTRAAKARSLDEAVTSYGEAITAGEYLALKQLDSTELKSLLTITEKINGIRAGGLAADDWVCVNVVC